MNTHKILLPTILIILIITIILAVVYFIFRSQDGTESMIGAKVPEFTLPDQDGNEFSIKDVVGKKNLVYYFYPKDFTGGCTKEACTFRDDFKDFVEADAIVIGISSQSVESHKAFAEKYNLPFTLLADTNNTVRKLFHVQTNEYGHIPGRVSFVVDKKGMIISTFNSLTQPKKHVEEALRILKGNGN